MLLPFFFLPCLIVRLALFSVYLIFLRRCSFSFSTSSRASFSDSSSSYDEVTGIRLSLLMFLVFLLLALALTSCSFSSSSFRLNHVVNPLTLLSLLLLS